MRRGGVAQLIHCVHNRIESRVVADRGVGAVEVVVDRAGQTHDGDIELRGKDTRTRQRAVATDNYQCVNAFALHCFVCHLATFGCLELLAASRFEDRTALLHDVADVSGLERNDLTRNQAAVATHNALDRETVIDCCARNGAYSCIHRRGVASRGENADTFDLCHSLLFVVKKFAPRAHLSLIVQIYE